MRDQLNATRCTKFLKALADPERLRIVQCLQGGPLSVSEITGRLRVPIANVSHHLKQLRVAGVVTGKKSGKQVIYALAPKVLKRPKGGGGGGDAGGGGRTSLDVLDFGCCRLELGNK